jgi:hypothetical protein
MCQCANLPICEFANLVIAIFKTEFKKAVRLNRDSPLKISYLLLTSLQRVLREQLSRQLQGQHLQPEWQQE